MIQSKLLYVVLLVGLGFNLLLLGLWQRTEARRATGEGRIEHIEKQKEESEKAFTSIFSAEFQHLGATLHFVDLETIQGIDARTWFQIPGLKLLLVFSELSCDVCQDRMTQLAEEVAVLQEVPRVAALLHGTRRQYAGMYIRTNGITFPVYFAKDDKVFKENGIACVPTAFLVEADGKVIGSHCPIPSQAWLTEQFFARCREIFSHPGER